MRFLKTLLVLFSLILSFFIIQSIMADELVIIYQDGSKQIIPFTYPYNQVIRFEVKTPYGTITSSSNSYNYHNLYNGYYKSDKPSVQYRESAIYDEKSLTKRGLRICNAPPQDGDIIDLIKKCK